MWTFDDEISTVLGRAWSFSSSDGSLFNQRIASISNNEDPVITPNSGLSGVGIEKPATLILENVNKTYNGTYTFALLGASSNVVVIIASKLTLLL